MQTSIKSLFAFILLSSALIGQPSRYASFGKLKAATSKEQIKNTVRLQDLSPDFWQRLTIPYELRIKIEKRQLVASAQGYNVFLPEKSLEKYLTVTASTITLVQN